MVGLLDPTKYGEYFYDLYTSNTRRKLQNDRRLLAKRKNKDKKAAAAAVLEGNAGAIVNNQLPIDPSMKDQLMLFPAFPIAHIELDANASKFAVFSIIRSTILEAETKYAIFHTCGASGFRVTGGNKLRSLSSVCCSVCVGACMVSNVSECVCHTVAPLSNCRTSRRDSINSDADTDNSDDATEKDTTSVIRVPLIVGAGLRSLFELIADARHIQPMLCTKALNALLDVIQGQQPESFKAEPEDLINPLYDMLLDLATISATSQSGGPQMSCEANWSAIACSALLGLCIARGDTGKMLKAIAAMLMSPKQLSNQIVQLPAVLSSLQNTVMSAVLNKPNRPDFHTQGIPLNSLVDQFALTGITPNAGSSQPAIASDGTFLYVLLGGSLYKIGSGFGGSFKGHIYAQNNEFIKEKSGWLGYCRGSLYFRRNSKRSADHLHIINTDTLTVKGINPMMMPIREGFNYLLFTDEDSLNAICTNRDDTLVVKRLNLYNKSSSSSGSSGSGSGYQGNSAESSPASMNPFELTLLLAHKKFRTLGYAAFEDDILNQNQIQKIQSSHNPFEPKLPHNIPAPESDIVAIGCGKEFGLVRSSLGKVFYYGKPAALGLKAIGRTPSLKMTELIISKLANIIQVAVGHDGIHALLLNDDGTVYFTGTARRGEDGDNSSKNRRQPKAVKPKKMSKIDGHFIVHAACNNGTSAFVTKTGKLIMFGKDTVHCDSQGYVSDFIDQHITKVALGKAHCVALNTKGEVYTFGLNNKGQCGRVLSKSVATGVSSLPAIGSSAGKDVTAASSCSSSGANAVDGGRMLGGKKFKIDFSTLCDYDDHTVVQGQCRVCVVCRECTGYNVSCVVPNEERLAGAICPCGHGDAGCSKCGLCSTCISIQESELDSKDAKLEQRPRAKTLIMRRKDKKSTQNDDIPSLHAVVSEMEKDPPRVAPLAPQLLNLPSTSPVVQVACGLHHTVLLTLAGEVFTFGSNQYGQLGTGDLQPIMGPVKVPIAQGNAISQVAAGSNHTVLMTSKGLVYTFGNYQKGQLGRLPTDPHTNKVASSGSSGCSSRDDQDTSNAAGSAKHSVTPFNVSSLKDVSVGNLLVQRQKFLWHCTPGVVFGLGPSFGKKATWIGASGDQTFIKIDESLITTQMLSKIHVVANKRTILLVPTIPLSFSVLSINRRDGTCTAHYNNQMNFLDLLQSNGSVCEASGVRKGDNVALPEINQNNTGSMASITVGRSGGFAGCGSSGGVIGGSTVSAGGAINDQMSRSMHEARNQIFDLSGEQQQKRCRARRHPQKDLEYDAGTTIAGNTSGSSREGTAVLDKCVLQIAFAMDPLYNVLWVYDGVHRQMLCFNILASEIARNENWPNYKAILSPELSLPRKAEARVSRSQASLNLLSCLDILTSSQDSIPGCFDEVLPKLQLQTNAAESNEYQLVNRFENFGGGWGYSGHSVEAIRFSADTDVMIGGFGMFGGRGEYTCKLKVYDLGPDGGGYEKEGVLISETKEVPFECAARSKYHILLAKPFNAAAGRWYLVWARIAGPSSDCGSCGQASVTTEDQVVFSFKSSKKANNGTDVNSGQIPAILYRLITQETKHTSPSTDTEPVQRISKAFSTSVTKECFESLVVLLNWSWESFKVNLREQRDKQRQLQVKQSLQYLTYVNKSCLRLLRKYTNEIYPQRSLVGFNSVPLSNSKVPGISKSMKGGQDKSKSTLGNSNACAGSSSSSQLPAAGSVSALPERKPNMENIQLAECIGNVRALLILIFCDDISKDIVTEEGHAMVQEILGECHLSFVACFDAFYPTSSLKWNCLCDLLTQMDKGMLHARLLSAILAGLCSPSVKLRTTFSLLNTGNERQSIISPSDNSGLPMLSSTDAHQYPILVEQMIYRTQLEKTDFVGNSWTFKDVLVRLLEIIANPIRSRIDICSRGNISANSLSNNKGLIDNCCHLLARVLAEIVYQTTLGDYDKMFLPPRSLHSTGSRFARCDVSRTWNTGNFGPDAIAFTVDRPGIAVAGALIYSGSGSYDYQLELLYDNSVDLQSQHKWEPLESVSGTYDQEMVHNDMVEIKFERPVHIKDGARYALRLCSQGARTCSGDAGITTLRGPCGTMFNFFSCDLSFNGTTPQRGQIPCILYYSTSAKGDSPGVGGPGNASNAVMYGTASGLGGSSAGGVKGAASFISSEVSARDTALQIAADITKKCSELLILARNTLASSMSPSDNSSSNHTQQTIDSEHNITPIEEHMDINWANNSRTSSMPPLAPLSSDPNISTARDLTKRIESFSKGLMETLKFDKRSTNPFEMEIEIGATEIHPKDLMIDESVGVSVGVSDLNFRNGEITKLNGNERDEDEVAEDLITNQQQEQQRLQGSLAGGLYMIRSDSEETPPTQLSVINVIEVFNQETSNMFHTLLPLVYAHIANLACSDPKSSVQILGLIKDILPHIAALNQIYTNKEQPNFMPGAQQQHHQRHIADIRKINEDALGQEKTSDTFTTSNHYCVVESEHPYRSATISCYRVEFPPCVKWLTIEFDTQCGTAQLEDYLLLSIPMYTQRGSIISESYVAPAGEPTGEGNQAKRVTRGPSQFRNATLAACHQANLHDGAEAGIEAKKDWIIVKKFNTSSNWMQNVMILPGNCIEFSLETSSMYAQDPNTNKYGFKCMVVGYDNPLALSGNSNSCLIRLEQELAYLGGMCSANLMKKDLCLPDDKDVDDLTGIEETVSVHHALLSKGFALSDPLLTVHQALESYLPIGSQSNERQFLKDFISGAPGSSGARLAAWLQPESRLDPNKCELNTITEPLRYGWPSQVTVTIRDQYGDAVLVPELKVTIKAIPTGSTCNGNIKMRRTSYTDSNTFGGMAPPPRFNYEPTVKEKMCFKAITFMKPFANYSFEELRFNSPVQTRVTETLYAQDMEDGTFSVHWTPNSVGSYCLTVTIDGILLEEVYRVEVKEGGMPPPSHTQSLKKPQPPNKLRKFFTKNTSGLRIRSHPTLQSEQVGVVKLNGVISFIDEIENDDGIWLRLSTESIRQHCTTGWYPTEAWCLQFNQHLDKMLLHPVGEAASKVQSEVATAEERSANTSAANADDSVGKSERARHKMLLENVEPPSVLSPSGMDSPTKSRIESPSKNVFDFAQGRCSPPKTSDPQTASTNPFLFANASCSLDGSDGDEATKNADVSGPLQDSADVEELRDGSHHQAVDLLQSLQSSSPSNIGSALAGVVGGGAIKLQALQKWFKGDSVHGPSGGVDERGSGQAAKSSDVTEIAAVSVRELVRAMSGQEAGRSNGNAAGAGSGAQISSTMTIPEVSKSTDTSHSSYDSSINRESGRHPKDSCELEPGNVAAADNFDISTMRMTNFTPSQTAALLSTPKHSPRKSVLANRRGGSPSSSSDQAVKDSDLGNLEEETSLLQITTTTTTASGGGVTSRDHIVISEGTVKTTGSTMDSTEFCCPPVWPSPDETINNENAGGSSTITNVASTGQVPLRRGLIGPIKRAMPPSFAESIRAVFAAFLWHEGIVHDAMACASFLKFHPSLPKEGAPVVTRRDNSDHRLHLSREQKAQQRHSVEVANAGNYLNIRPSTLETLAKSGVSSLNNRKNRKNVSCEDAGCDKQKLHSLPEVVTVLPPALRCLVFLWEQVCSNCIQIVQSNAFERERYPSSPVRDVAANAKDKDEVATEKDPNRKPKKKKKDDGSWCEICEVFLPIPVTYHMRIVHPGCGKSAKGKGYNSVGIFCEGWAGSCGEGGKGASSWFLMCDMCRDKYLSMNKNTNNVNSHLNLSSSGNEMNMFGVKTTTLIANSEIYTTMKDNATFLLELSSHVSNLPSSEVSANSLGSAAKRSPQQMPVVIENQHFNMVDLNKPSTSRSEANRFSRNSCHMSGKFPNMNRKSYAISPDKYYWVAPETFACLESLGANVNEDLPYEIFGMNSNENFLDRPLSDVTYDADSNNFELMTGSVQTQTGILSKFHRSFSMGQGWGAVQQQQPGHLKGLATNQSDENSQPKVVYRRRPNSSLQMDGGSLLICYPSENLRRLVPENMLNTSVVHTSVNQRSTVIGVTEEGGPTVIQTIRDPPTLSEATIMSTGHKIAATHFDLTLGKSQAEAGKESCSDSVNDASDAMQNQQLNQILNRPAMAFITQKHDLEKLRNAMKRSLRISVCRIYSLQALNWLIRSVTQNVCLHDLMWWFVSSLSITSVEMVDGKYEEVEPALEHPVTYTQMSGRFSQMITQSLHVFLQSVADLTLYLPLGSPLQRIAIQCFGLRFRQTDHQFLHNSHVFGNISKILSKSDEQDDAMAQSMAGQAAANASSGDCVDAEHNFAQAVSSVGFTVTNAGAKVLQYTDLNGMFEITVSSRQAMAESLVDNSTETFWESDEEDRNKCKIIEISMTKVSYTCKVVLVHIDNSRDIQNKVLNVVFYAGQSLGDTNLIKSVDVDPKTCAWISAKVTNDSHTHFRLEFQGPENTLRVRQIKLLGLPTALAGVEPFGDSYAIGGREGTQNSLKSNVKFTNASRIQQQICEAETLRVFRLITGQVFGKLISTAGQDTSKGTAAASLENHHLTMDSSVNSMLADSLDLREHMVGILFSRSKLSHLQRQVIVHIVYAIKKEAQRAKEDWEIVNLANCFKHSIDATTTSATSACEPKSESSSERYRAPDTYCFEMLSMVLALSGSVVGRSYISHQHDLLKDLLSLLHTGSDRVQRQVTALLRRILPEILPDSFAEILGVHRLPPTDYNIAHNSAADFDMNRLGLLDIFLAVIAKSLQLQVKVKTTSGKAAGMEKTPTFLRLCNSLDLSVHLLKQPKKAFDEQEPEDHDTDQRYGAQPFRFDCTETMGNEYKSTVRPAKKESKKNLNQRWFLNGIISTKQAESIISLIRDLANGKLGEKWSQLTKAAIAESVLNLTRLDEVFRAPESCIKTATLWLALASLCVLDRDHVEKLSSGQWSKISNDTRPMCTNHDDGETSAIIQCETCGSLCGDCDRFLHLNRKTRSHKRTVCKEEEEAIRVELHESCGRTKLFWLLALADSKTLKAMVEFRDGSHTIISGPQEAVGRCRFCGITGNSGLLEIGNVCADAQCQEYAANSCMKTKPCGHACGGVVNETKCLPCLQNVCHARENEIAEELHEPKLTQDADDMCMICFVEAVSCAPAIHLECGHVFHYHCCKTVLEKRWSGPRITFGFSLCPICKADIQHNMLNDILEPINSLKQDVKRKALMRLKYEGVVKDTDSQKDVTNLAMDRYAYYVCFKCKKAYYGGEARCDAEIGEKFDPEELVCGGCSDVARAQMCPKHGTDFLEYKCRYCCSVAVFFCFGTTHFCDTCHDDFQRLTNIPKNKLPQCPAGPKAKQLMGDECPLHVLHPATGEEFALGCGVCRNAQTF